ncbi:hypothetical protein [Mumia zhuanghuii]|nr:hypothetical protein [Mumia zhuanghuii]
MPACRWLDAQSDWLATLDATVMTYGRLPELTYGWLVWEWLLLHQADHW